MGHTCTQSVRDSSVRILTSPIFSLGNTLPHITLSLTHSLTHTCAFSLSSMQTYVYSHAYSHLHEHAYLELSSRMQQHALLKGVCASLLSLLHRRLRPHAKLSACETHLHSVYRQMRALVSGNRLNYSYTRSPNASCAFTHSQTHSLAPTNEAYRLSSPSARFSRLFPLREGLELTQRESKGGIRAKTSLLAKARAGKNVPR